MTELCQREVAEQSGLPGPMVAKLVARAAGTDGSKDDPEAPIYAQDSVARARLARLMLQAGVRHRVIATSVNDPETVNSIEEQCREWAELIATRPSS